MIAKIISYIRDGVRYVSFHPQLLFTLLLVVIIPYAFLISGQQFLNASRENQERLERDRIGIMHDVFAAYLTAVDFDPIQIEIELEELVSLNPDIKKFRIAKETVDGIEVVATLKNDTLAKVKNESDYRLAQVSAGQSVTRAYERGGIRYWHSFRLVQSGGEEYYIFTETSLEYIDALFRSRIQVAYFWLFGLLGIVLVLVVRHVRLTDYGYLYRETKKANEMKDLFTSMIAHELRAPLTAIKGYASLIRENKTLDPRVAEQGGRIEESADRLVVIVSDLLDIARIQSGKLAVVKEEVNVSAVICSVLDSLASVAEKKHIKIDAEGITNPVLIKGDNKRLHQALTNLVSNALKYTAKGNILVSVKTKYDRVEIRVEDTGMGIEAAAQKELFAPFYRVKNSKVSAITGTGLGMWITKQLVELMGGSIGVESIKGVGTHVVVTLPVH